MSVRVSAPLEARAAARDGEREARLAEIQRSRLLAGAVGAIEENGYAHTTVAQITARARVSRRTFYELFENREECLAALIDEMLASVQSQLVVACVEGLPWQERVRAGLLTILAFFDHEPALARVCVVEALRGGSRVQGRREEIMTRLAAVIDEGRDAQSRKAECSTLTAEALVGAAFAIVHSRLSRQQHEPLTDLVAELMSLIVLPYRGPAAARRERDRPISDTARAAAGPELRLQSDHDPLQDVPMRLTYRTARVLLCIAGHPGISNRAVAQEAGITDQGQVSKLLARLERLGLTVNSGTGHARGEANAWGLSALGEQVAERLNLSHTSYEQHAA